MPTLASKASTFPEVAHVKSLGLMANLSDVSRMSATDFPNLGRAAAAAGTHMLPSRTCYSTEVAVWELGMSYALSAPYIVSQPLREFFFHA